MGKGKRTAFFALISSEITCWKWASSSRVVFNGGNFNTLLKCGRRGNGEDSEDSEEDHIFCGTRVTWFNSVSAHGILAIKAISSTFHAFSLAIMKLSYCEWKGREGEEREGRGRGRKGVSNIRHTSHNPPSNIPPTPNIPPPTKTHPKFPYPSQ